MQNRGGRRYNTSMRKFYDNSSFTISVDADCDLPVAQLAAFGVIAQPHDYRADGILCGNPDCESDYDRLSEELSDGKILARNKPTREAYEDFFDSIFETGVRSLVHIAPDSEVTGDYFAAIKAAKNELIKFPRCELYIVNSHAFSAGLLPIINEAISLRDAGTNAAEAFVALSSLSERAQTYFIPTDSPQTRDRFPVSAGGKVLNVRPVCRVTSGGKYSVIRKPRGNAMACSALAKLAASASASEVYVSFGSSPDFAVALKRKLAELLPGVKVELSRTGLLADFLVGGDSTVVGFVDKSKKLEEK